MKRAKRGRQAELLEAGRRERDEAEDGVEPAVLAVEIAAEAPGARDLVTEIEVAVLGEELALPLGQRGEQHPLDRRRLESGLVHRDQPARDAELDAEPAVQMDVARPLGDAAAQDAVQLGRAGGGGSRRGRARDGGGRGRACGRLAALLRDHLRLRLHQLRELLLGQEALLDQDVAQALGRVALGLLAGRLGELLERDHLQVDGETPQERRTRRLRHGLALIGGCARAL